MSVLTKLYLVVFVAMLVLTKEGVCDESTSDK